MGILLILWVVGSISDWTPSSFLLGCWRGGWCEKSTEDAPWGVRANHGIKRLPFAQGNHPWPHCDWVGPSPPTHISQAIEPCLGTSASHMLASAQSDEEYCCSVQEHAFSLWELISVSMSLQIYWSSKPSVMMMIRLLLAFNVCPFHDPYIHKYIYAHRFCSRICIRGFVTEQQTVILIMKCFSYSALLYCTKYADVFWEDGSTKRRGRKDSVKRLFVLSCYKHSSIFKKINFRTRIWPPLLPELGYLRGWGE